MSAPVKMPKNVVIPNHFKLEEVKKAIIKDGPSQLHLVSDFDRTLTTAFVDGKKVPSLTSVLRDGSFLSQDYAKKAHALYEKYHPIELNPGISFDEKKKAMEKWWLTHFKLLIKSGLNKKDLAKIVKQETVKIRPGADKFFSFLKVHNIPLVILSADGLGGDAINLFLKKEKKKSKNIFIVSNSYLWDQNGRAIDIKGPIIHAMNKDETTIHSLPFYNQIKNRKNVILLGDGLEDINMIKGFDYKNLIKIGFLNENVSRNLKYYQKAYDVIFLNDAPMNYLNDLLAQITGDHSN